MLARMIPLALVAAVAIGGCAAPQRAARPAYISHIVFASLIEPLDRAELIADSEARLATIPSVVSFAAGEHIDTGRDTVLADYDVGIYLGFASVEGLAEYVAHPRHIAFVRDWGPRVRSLRVYDVADPTP